ncbi:MAG: glycoside hydrolase family 88 protein [Clostridia bacterium]|nr:glycoside hydrolase family 88 protein [Clostridia bacterium]
MLTEYLPHSAQAVADCTMARYGLLNRKWSYDYGVVWRGMEMLYALTGDCKYFDYVFRALDGMTAEDGTIQGYDREAYNLDYLCNGRQMIFLYQQTGEEKYKKAAALLRSQLDGQPRTSDGGFWHKKVYPYQMWLDGQHMAIPFYLQYEAAFGPKVAAQNDAAKQLILAYRHTLNPETSLPCHGWDEQKQQLWADPVTGRAAHAWGRAVGWYMVALADSLELLPKENCHYTEVLEIFQQLSEKLLSIRQDGVWLQVLDCPGRTGNYSESSGSCLITYALLKGARLGYLPKETGVEAQKSFEAIQRHFVGRMKNGETFVAKCCQGAGLGGSSGRDGSFDYYISENVISFDLKATGAYIQAATEEEIYRTLKQRSIRL